MKLCRLDEVCDFQSGLWTGKKGPYKVVKVLRNTNFTKDNKLNLENIAEIKVEVKQFEKRVLEKGDILIEKSGGGPNQPVGRVVLIDKRAVDYSFSNFTSRIRVSSDDLNPNYLYWFLNYIYLSGKTENLQRRSTGIRNLQLKEYKQLVIPVPSLQEQEKIVEKLGKVFDNIDKLTEDSAKNIENSKNLFFSFINETFISNSSKELIELEKLSTHISRGLQPKYTDKSKTLVINQRCIRDNQINFEVGRYHDQNIKKVSDDKKIQIGDILINSTGVGTLGRVAQVTELPNVDVTVDTHVTIFRPNFNILDKEFTNWLFIYLENLIEKMGVGASGQTELRREDLKNMKITTPPNEKIQQDISDKLNKLKNPYDNYLKLKEDLITKYSMLRKSILDKEFSYE